MTEATWVLTAGFGALALLGIPFAIAIALAVTGALLVADIEPAFLAQSVISGSAVNSACWRSRSSCSPGS